MKHIKHVKYILPTDQYISHLPDYSKFRRKNNTQNESRSYTGFTLEINQCIPYNKYWMYHDITNDYNCNSGNST